MTQVCTTLFLATRNKHKTREIQMMLGELVVLQDASAFPLLPTIEETGSSFESNARLKAEGISRLVSGWVLADDSGLEIDALGGEPGIFSARYAGPGCSDCENRELVLKKMSHIPKQNRGASFQCVLAVAHSGKTVALFHGSVEGAITTTIMGEGGFGYDPIFIPQGYRASFGELSLKIKNRISHRACALEQLRIWFEETKHLPSQVS